jgi:hypothetical protein
MYICSSSFLGDFEDPPHLQKICEEIWKPKSKLTFFRFYWDIPSMCNNCIFGDGISSANKYLKPFINPNKCSFGQ